MARSPRTATARSTTTSLPSGLGDAGDLSALVGASVMEQLAHAARATPAVLAIEALPFLVDMAFPLVADAILPTTLARMGDARVTVPTGDRWTMDEVDTLLVAPTAFIPHVRNLILVTDADRMSAACADHLLKAIEEPLSPTTYCLGVSDSRLLPATIRGRIGQHVRMRVEDSALVDWLVSCGLAHVLAQRAVTYFATQAALLAQLADSPDQIEALVDLASHLPDPKKAAGVARKAAMLLADVAAATAIDPLTGPSASSASGSVPKASASEATAASRRRVRRLASSVLEAWRSVAIQALVSPEPSLITVHPEMVAAGQVVAAQYLAAIDQAELVLSRNGSVALALALAAGPVDLRLSS